MNHLIVAIIYALTTACALIVSILNSPFSETGIAAAPDTLSAIETALIMSGPERAADVAVVDLLSRGGARTLKRGQGLRTVSLSVDGPSAGVILQEAGLLVEVASGQYRRLQLLRRLKKSISARQDRIVARGLVRSARDMIWTIARTSYPLVASTGFGLFLLWLFPDKSWIGKVLGSCFATGLGSLVLVNIEYRLTGAGRATRDAIRHKYANAESVPPLTYAVAVWGVDTISLSPYAAYVSMADVDKYAD